MTQADLLKAVNWLGAHANFVIPLFLSIWMAWGDVKSRRIPNYLTLGAALAGLGFQVGLHGWSGLASGLLGMVLGFGLLIAFYVMGGMGAGDVKALAALGTWLGPSKTFELFIYMAIFGGVLSVLVMAWRGQLWQTFKQGWQILKQGWTYLKNLVLNYILLKPHKEPVGRQAAANPAPPSGGIPYAVAMAAGMAVLLVRNI
jgi:prepilin peptidase CpaA